MKVRDDGQNMALFALKSWPIGGGGHGPGAPPPGTALGYSLVFVFVSVRRKLNSAGPNKNYSSSRSSPLGVNGHAGSV